MGVGEGIKVTAKEQAPRPHEGSVQSVATNCNEVTVPTKVLLPGPGLIALGPKVTSKHTPAPPTARYTSPRVTPTGYRALPAVNVTVLKGFLQHVSWI